MPSNLFVSHLAHPYQMRHKKSLHECIARLGDVLGPRHQAGDRKPSRVLEKPRQIAFRDKPVPQRSPDHGHHRSRGLGPADGLGEEEVLPVDDEGLGDS